VDLRKSPKNFLPSAKRLAAIHNLTFTGNLEAANAKFYGNGGEQRAKMK
jgi:hypothetical protein